MVGIAAKGNPDAFFPRDLEQAQFEILAICVAIDLHRLIKMSCFREDSRPVGAKTPVDDYRRDLEGAPEFEW